MKKTVFTAWIAVLVVLLFSLTACTMKTTDPSDVTGDKVTLLSSQMLTENGKWVDAPEEAGKQLFDLVREVGELKSEALDIAVSGSSTIETVYDHSFTLSVKTGNFFVRKEGSFVYKIGERFTRTYNDGKENTRYEEDKLVVTRAFSKDVATLSEVQLQLVRDVFETVNADEMSKAFENVAKKSQESGYLVTAIEQESLSAVFFTLFETPFDAKDHLLKGYEIDTADGSNYVFLTDSAEWAKKIDAHTNGGSVGRVCFFARSYSNAIENALKS